MIEIFPFDSESSITELNAILAKYIDSQHITLGIGLRGHTRVLVNNKTYDISYPHFTLTLPDMQGKFLSVDKDFKGYFLVINKSYTSRYSFFRNSIYDRFIKSFPIAHLKQESADIAELYCQLILRLKEHHKDPIYLNEILINLARSASFEFASSFFPNRMHFNGIDYDAEYAMYRDFKVQLSLHHQENRNISFYAAMYNIDKRNFTRIIKRISGRTPKDWISEEVLFTSKNLLINPDIQINTIADGLNFAHASAFGSFFKSKTGVSPQEYRKLILNMKYPGTRI